MGHTILALPLLVLACISAPLAAQPCGEPVWREVAPGPPATYETRVVTDQARRRIVSLGTSTATGQTSVHEWDGFGWEIVTAEGPASLIHPALAFDPVGGVTVLFGGTCWSPAWDCNAEPYRDETWLWDGFRWTLAADGGPEGRMAAGIASFPSAGQVVLFGGGELYSYIPPENDTTWVWDGATWIAHDGPGPSPRYFPAMAHDPASDRMILFGGWDGDQEFGDTWAWDGTGWELLDAQGPAARTTSAFGTDPQRNRIVMHGGISGEGIYRDTWEWTGTAWHKIADDGPIGGFAAYDPTRNAIILYETGIGDDYLMESWELHGNEWTLDHSSLVPSNRSVRQVVSRTAREEILMHGGVGDGWDDEWLPETWSYRDGIWSLLNANGPDLRHGSPVYDPVNDRVFWVDTYRLAFWEWIGDQWEYIEFLSFGNGGGGRAVYDEARKEIVWIGSGQGPEQWSWDGTQWRQWSGDVPRLRQSAVLVYDPRRERVVLVNADWDDPLTLWEWDGELWQEFEATELGTRGDPGVCYDAQLERVLLFGGSYWQNGQHLQTDTWAWDGSAWEMLDDGSAPAYRTHVMAFDPSINATRRFGRFTQGAPVVSHWVFQAPVTPSVDTHPADTDATEGGYAAMIVHADGHSALDYTWRRNGIPLADDARIVGSRRRTLSIEPVTLDDAGEYDVIITNDCGTTLSQAATLTVNVRCPGDFDADGDADPSDVAAFLDAWRADSPDADFNADGILDTRDVIAFLAAWAAGCP